MASSHKKDWDEDKEVQEEEDRPRKEWRVMDQGEWNAKKRVERPGEFAPPSSYGQVLLLLLPHVKLSFHPTIILPPSIFSYLLLHTPTSCFILLPTASTSHY